jgi:hydrogenase 3 maturation protease
MSNSYANILQDLKLTPSNISIIGVGNSLRHDDAIGPYVCSKLNNSDKMQVLDAGMNPENVIDDVCAHNPKQIIIIDAANFGKDAGEIALVHKDQIPETSISTHMISLKVIAGILAEDTKAEIIFIGIQFKDVSLGEGMCEEVRKAGDEIVEKITKGVENA